jgi:hypothetical protein
MFDAVDLAVGYYNAMSKYLYMMDPEVNFDDLAPCLVGCFREAM